jgi:hypothetical protein
LILPPVIQGTALEFISMQAGKQLKRLKRRVKICGVETRQKNYVRRAPKLSRKSFNNFELARKHTA